MKGDSAVAALCATYLNWSSWAPTAGCRLSKVGEYPIFHLLEYFHINIVFTFIMFLKQVREVRHYFYFLLTD